MVEEKEPQKHNCESCSFRAKYDVNPKSLIGRFWRWHINFCQGWKKYMTSQTEEQKQILVKKYNLVNK